MVTWNPIQIKKFVQAIAEIMEKNKDYLIELDGKAGDGDLGLTMSDGFLAAAEAIKDSDETDCGMLLYGAGKAMAGAVPSTMGTLMAKGMQSAGKALKGKTEWESGAVYEILNGWKEGVEKLGKAKPGEKTFLDGLTPAVELLRENKNSPMEDVLEAARAGAKSTVGMAAVHGRAAIRGEASKELLDPGAVVAGLIVEALYQSMVDKGAIIPNR